MTPEQKLARTKKLVSAAKALLSLQTGIAVGAQRIMNCLYLLGPEFEDKHKVFGKFIQAIPSDIPIGSVRLLWNYDPMLKTDKGLAEVENKFRESLLSECVAIIRAYG